MNMNHFIHLRRIVIVPRRTLRQSRLAQICVLLGFWLLGETLVRLTSLQLPGGVVGMAIVLALLHGRWISLFTIRRGANWFIAEMLLFFVPAVMILLDHHELLGSLGLKLIAVIVGSTVLVMAGTALAVEFIHRRRTHNVSV